MASSDLSTSSVYRMSGTDLFSGLDTDNIIKALTSNTQSKIDRQKQLEQIAQWKQELYRDVISDMQDFSDKYFSYTNSETNLLSSTFFNTSDIVSSSDAVTATGDLANAQNLVINSVSQLAAQASYTADQQVSKEAITSGAIRETWTKSAVGGKTLVVNYNGTDYALTLSNSVQLDSANMTTTDGIKTELRKVVDGFNDQIDANADLKGRVRFDLNGDGTGFALSSTDTAYPVQIKAYASDKDDTSGIKFLTALGLSSGDSGKTVEGSAVDTDPATSGLFNKTVSSSSYLKFKVDGSEEEYTVKLGENLDCTGADKKQTVKAIEAALQKQVEASDDLKGKIGVSLTEAGVLQFRSKGGGSISVSGGSQDLLQGLGLEGASAEAGAPISVEESDLDAGALFQSSLGDTLAGNTVTFTLDGVSKTVAFDASRQGDYDSAAEIQTYLQDKLDGLFGSGKITVSEADGALSFKTQDMTSVLSMTSSDGQNVLSATGALRIATGETNRAELSKTLGDLAGELNAALEEGTLEDGTNGYSITVNGKEFTFTGDTTLGNVISRINSDAQAGVTVSHSQTTDTFRIVADDSGSQGQIEFSDGTGNLAGVLFGTYNEGLSTAGKDLEMNVTLNGSTFDLTRSSNTTALDGVNLQITGTTDEPVTFSSESDIDDLSQKIVDFVNDYNKIIDKVNTLTSQAPDTDEDYQPLTDAQKEDMSEDEIEKWNEKAKEGLLQNDSALNGILSDLRAAVGTIEQTTGLSLSKLGISTQAYDYTSGGQLAVDTEQLKETLTGSPDAVKDLFTGSDGVSQKIKDVLDKYVGTFGGDGILLLRAGSETRANDTSLLSTQIKEYQDTVDTLTDRLTDEQDRWWSKFTAMEQALSTLSAQSSYLTSMFSGDQNS